MSRHSRNPFHNNFSQNWWWELILSPWTWFLSQRSSVQQNIIFCSKTTLESHCSPMKSCLEEGLCTVCGLCTATLPSFSCPGLLMLGNKKTTNQPKAGLLFSSCSISNLTQHPNLSCLAQQKECLSTSSAWLHVAMRCSGAELEARLHNLLPALSDWIWAFITGLLLSSCILDATLRPRNSICLFSQRQKTFKCYCRRR